MHPSTAGIDWALDELIYDPTGGIALAMFQRNNGAEQAVGFRWVEAGAAQTYFGKSSEWILLPHEFAVCVARRMIEKKAAGMSDIREIGFQRMMDYLLESEEIVRNICY